MALSTSRGWARWALLVSALGTSTAFMPWRCTGVDFLGTVFWSVLPATETWHGVVPAVVFGVVGVVLVPTFATEGAPVWKIALLALAGAVAITSCAAYVFLSQETLVTLYNKRMPSGLQYTAIAPAADHLYVGFYVALACGAAFVVLAAVQVRSALFDRPRAPTTVSSQAEQGATADGDRDAVSS